MSVGTAGKIVAIDSMIRVWGVRTEGHKDKVKHTRWLLQEFDATGTQIIVPSVAVAEYLVPVEPGKHSDVVGALAERFIIAPFDARCASIAARLFSEGKRSYPMKTRDARKLLKSDSLIIATAVTHGANIFYSDDAKCRALAKKCERRLNVMGLPTIAPDLYSQ